MKKLQLLIIVLLTFFASQVQGQTTVVNELVIKALAKSNSATRIMVHDSITKKTAFILKSSLKTDLSQTITPTNITISPGNGTSVVLPLVTIVNSGLQSPSDKTKLNGIATGATANQTDAYLLSRANHTGTQDVSTIIGLSTLLNTKEPVIVAGSTLEYWRGDKTWNTLNKTVVGLSNVDNTTDLNKPISTATQTALNTKEPTIATGLNSQYWRGDKTWQTLPPTFYGNGNVIPKSTGSGFTDSRLTDNGTYFGIGTSVTPVYDVTLGNQNNKTIGIETSASTVSGKDLTLLSGSTSAGATLVSWVNTNNTNAIYEQRTVTPTGVVYMASFDPQWGDASLTYQSFEGDGYATSYYENGQYIRSFAISLQDVPYLVLSGTETGTGVIHKYFPATRVYGAVSGMAAGNYRGITTAPNGDIYAYTATTLYKQLNNATSFVAVTNQASVGYQDRSIFFGTNGDLYLLYNNPAPTLRGQLYKSVAGGAFILQNDLTTDVGINATAWYNGLQALNGDIYAVSADKVYRKALGEASFTKNLIASVPAGDFAASPRVASNGDILLNIGYKFTPNGYNASNTFEYRLSFNSGPSNINGGTLNLYSGIGKGTGTSNVDIYTSQKLGTGTILQTNVLRARINNEGLLLLPSITNAIITADATGKAAITKEYLDSKGFLPIAGNVTKTGILNFSNSTLDSGINFSINSTASGVGGITFTNDGSNKTGILGTNLWTGQAIKILNSGTTGIEVVNSGGGYGIIIGNTTNGIGIDITNTGTSMGGRMFNNGTGIGQTLVNSSSGRGYSTHNFSTGVGYYLNSTLPSTGDLFQTNKNDVLTGKIDHLGNVTAPSFIKSGGLATQFLMADGGSNSTVYAPIASPTFTGTPTVPTATAESNGLQIANKDYVLANGASNALLLTGDQIATGRKALTSNNTTVGGLNIVNNKTTTTAGTSDQSGLFIDNLGTSGILVDNRGADGIIAKSIGTGSAVNIQTFSTGIGLILRNQGGTGDLLSAELGATRIESSGAFISNNITATGLLKLKSYTVSTLPTGVQGATAYVTDALSPTYLAIISGGGTVVTPVFFNGTNWVAH